MLYLLNFLSGQLWASHADEEKVIIYPKVIKDEITIFLNLWPQRARPFWVHRPGYGEQVTVGKSFTGEFSQEHCLERDNVKRDHCHFQKQGAWCRAALF